MSTQKVTTRNTVLILMILFAVAMRLVSYKFQWLSNFTPVGAVALFGGAYFTNKWNAYVVPLIALVISDLIINYLYTSSFAIYSSSLWLYGCFMLMVLVGTLIKKVNVTNVALASIASVFIHWMIMDLPVMYGLPFTLANYGTLLVKAIYPFETNMLIGDAIYGLILFGGFEFAKRHYTFLRAKPELAL